jgi:hypothetical protein
MIGREPEVNGFVFGSSRLSSNQGTITPGAGACRLSVSYKLLIGKVEQLGRDEEPARIDRDPGKCCINNTTSPPRPFSQLSAGTRSYVANGILTADANRDYRESSPPLFFPSVPDISGCWIPSSFSNHVSHTPVGHVPSSSAHSRPVVLKEARVLILFLARRCDLAAHLTGMKV